ncbi:MAG: response regulator transcription factor [Chloroflexi bacterium]|nr:response regulator transcription factor [Chloroflexota bacterium]
MIRLAVVAEDAQSGQSLAEAVHQDGYESRLWSLSEPCLEEIRQFQPSLVLIDCETIRGLGPVFAELCKAIKVPVFALVPGPGHEQVVRALRMGAYGCLAKPYHEETLLAYIEACLRRHLEWSGEEQHTQQEPFLDVESCIMRLQGEEIQLTETECRLLQCLLARRGRVVPREDISSYVWGEKAPNASEISLNLCIYRLRHKIERDPSEPEHIRTKWGIGYYWADT